MGPAPTPCEGLLLEFAFLVRRLNCRVPERSTIFLLFLFNANNRTTKGIVNNNSVNVKAGEQQ